MQIVIHGQPITKKNSSRLVRAGNRVIPIPSKQYVEYERMALPQIQSMDTIDRPVNIRAVYHMKTRRKVDLVNLLEATLDILVKAKVIEDDNCSVVVSHDGSRVLYDKDNPRVEIDIEEAFNEE